jgi:hypothetical protein
MFAVLQPKCITSLQEEWAKVDPAPEGIIDHLVGFFVDLYRSKCCSAFDKIVVGAEMINRCYFSVKDWMLVIACKS